MRYSLRNKKLSHKAYCSMLYIYICTHTLQSQLRSVNKTALTDFIPHSDNLASQNDTKIERYKILLSTGERAWAKY